MDRGQIYDYRTCIGVNLLGEPIECNDCTHAGDCEEARLSVEKCEGCEFVEALCYYDTSKEACIMADDFGMLAPQEEAEYATQEVIDEVNNRNKGGH